MGDPPMHGAQVGPVPCCRRARTSERGTRDMMGVPSGRGIAPGPLVKRSSRGGVRLAMMLDVVARVGNENVFDLDSENMRWISGPFELYQLPPPTRVIFPGARVTLNRSFLDTMGGHGAGAGGGA